MNLAHHYRTLGLRRSASFGDVKAAYRQLVRECHPDINPDKAAVDRFIQINAAYTAISEALQPKPNDSTQATDVAKDPESSTASTPLERINLKELKLTLERLGIGNFQQDSSPQEPPSRSAAPREASTTKDTTTVADHAVPSQQNGTSQAPSVEASPCLSQQDISLKKGAYDQLRDLLKQQKFPRAIALVEGLAHRMPDDSEINQWQAIVYQRWGRQLISQGQFQKARLYLQKALQTDPNNPSLIHEVSRDMGLLKHIQAAEATL